MEERCIDCGSKKAHENSSVVAGLLRGERGRDRSALRMPEDNDERHTQMNGAQFEAGEDGFVCDVSGDAYDKKIPEALIENDFGRDAGIRAREHRGKGVLTRRELQPACGIAAEARRPSGGESPIPIGERPKGFVRCHERHLHRDVVQVDASYSTA